MLEPALVEPAEECADPPLVELPQAARTHAQVTNSRVLMHGFAMLKVDLVLDLYEGFDGVWKALGGAAAGHLDWPDVSLL
jgi:hypothetical protein